MPCKSVLGEHSPALQVLLHALPECVIEISNTYLLCCHSSGLHCPRATHMKGKEKILLMARGMCSSWG